MSIGFFIRVNCKHQKQSTIQFPLSTFDHKPLALVRLPNSVKRGIKMRVIIFLFCVFGMVEILINGGPTKPIRNLFSKSKIGEKFIRCPLCLGFWVGIFWGYWFLPEILSPWYINSLSHSCMGAGGAYLLHNLLPPSFTMGSNEEPEPPDIHHF